MPVILDPERFDDWLDTSRPTDDAKALAQPYAGDMTLYQVSTRVNSVLNDDAECVERIAVET